MITAKSSFITLLFTSALLLSACGGSNNSGSNNIDPTVPVITLNGEASMSIGLQSDYIDQGAMVTDDIDDSIELVITGEVDTSIEGSYDITYSATDSDGNTVSITRTIVVSATVGETNSQFSLNGDALIRVNLGETYEELGATFIDITDVGNEVAISGVVDTQSLGSYEINYTVTDSSGVQKTLTRTVNVILFDETKPEIVLNGESTITLKKGEIYNELGVTVTDNIDDNLVASIVGAVDSQTIGLYTLTYSVVDTAGNRSEISRTIHVIDPTAPFVTLNGATVITLEVNTPYQELGASAEDENGNTLSVEILGSVDHQTIGSNVLTYRATDTNQIITELNRTVNVVDTTAPTITLNGKSVLKINVGLTYFELGATIADNYDAELNYEITGQIDTSITGSQSIWYTATDASGNSATPVERVVNIVDVTAPNITLLGDNDLQIEYLEEFNHADVQVSDNYDGSVDLIVTGMVNNTELGQYTITYSAIDQAGNEANTLTRTITVVDTTPPLITLNGASVINIDQYQMYTELSASVSDNYDSQLEVVISGMIDTSIIGSNTLTYSVMDSQTNAAETKTRIVNIVDATAPVITLNGEAEISISQNANYIELGAEVSDNHDQNIQLTINGEIDPAIIGIQTIEFKAEDLAGNITTVSRTVTVLDVTAPIITINGETLISLIQHEEYIELSAQVSDNHDVDIQLITEGMIDTSALGEQQITYRAEDSAGNQTSVTRTITIIDVVKPEITLNGQSEIFIDEQSVYEELGATVTDNQQQDIQINITQNIDTSIIGTQYVEYSATDLSGNETVAVRTVQILDITKPEITLSGDALIIWDVNQPYLDAGVIVTDNHTNQDSILISNNLDSLDTAVLGEYNITYKATDEAGNFSETNRTISVVDTVAPELILIGETIIRHPELTAFNDPGYTVSDNYDDSETITVSRNSTVQPDVLGSYLITYTATDSSGNSTQIVRTVQVVDITPPTIEFRTSITIYQGQDFTDYLLNSGVKAVDNHPLNSLKNVTIDMSQFDNNVLGEQYIYYQLKDNYGNVSAPHTRLVTVIEDMPPEIIFENGLSIDVELYSEFSILEGVTVNDDRDSNLVISTSGMFDINSPGQYEVTYSVTDRSGQQVTSSRIINVVARPFITYWKTDNQGASDDNQIQIQVDRNFDGFNFNVDWGDGTFSTNVQATITHSYDQPGEYYVSITGDFPKTYFSYNSDSRKLLSVEQWGDIQWQSMDFAFARCENLVINASDTPDLSNATSMNETFSNATNFNSNINNWDVSTITSMRHTFENLPFFNQPLSDWDMSNVEDVYRMFNRNLLFNQDISGWDVSSVKNFERMFEFANSFNSDISSWEVDAATNMKYMFNGADAFNIDISGWNVSKVTTMEGMFAGTDTFNIDISGWDISSLRSFNGLTSMFSGATAFNQNLSAWDITHITKLSYMFSGATSFNQPLDWNTENVKSFSNLFDGAINFNQDISNWNTQSAESFAGMFKGATSFDGKIGTWDVTNAIYFFGMFQNAGLSVSNYDQLLVGWAAQGVSLNKSFDAGNSRYSNIDEVVTARAVLTNGKRWQITDGGMLEPFISTWKTDNYGYTASDQIKFPGYGTNYTIDWGDGNVDYGVTSVQVHTYDIVGTYQIKVSTDLAFRMYFEQSSPFSGQNNSDYDKIISVDQWGEVTWRSMSYAFHYCQELQILATDAPDLSNVKSMYKMFDDAIKIDADINHWNVSNVEDMRFAFAHTEIFNSPLNDWDVSNVKYLSGMFSETQAFNQPLHKWDTSSVIEMGGPSNGFINPNRDGVFEDAIAFNQYINTWDVSNVTIMTNLFKGASNFDQRLDDWDVSSVTQMDYMFTNASDFDQDISDWDITSVTSMIGMLSGSSFSSSNYILLLRSWGYNNNVQPNVKFSAGSAQYRGNPDTSSGGRERLIENKNWTIFDGGRL